MFTKELTSLHHYCSGFLSQRNLMLTYWPIISVSRLNNHLAQSKVNSSASKCKLTVLQILLLVIPIYKQQVGFLRTPHKHTVGEDSGSLSMYQNREEGLLGREESEYKQLSQIGRIRRKGRRKQKTQRPPITYASTVLTIVWLFTKRNKKQRMPILHG